MSRDVRGCALAASAVQRTGCIDNTPARPCLGRRALSTLPEDLTAIRIVDGPL